MNVILKSCLLLFAQKMTQSVHGDRDIPRFYLLQSVFHTFRFSLVEVFSAFQSARINDIECVLQTGLGIT